MSEPRPLKAVNDERDGGIRGTASQDTVIEKSSKKRWWIVGALGAVVSFLVLLAPGFLDWIGTERSIARSELRFATVERTDFVRDITAQGTVIAAVRPTLFAGDPGTVTYAVAAGDRVTEGDLIATIDSPELTNEWRREIASLDSLATNLQRQTIENRKLVLAARQTVDIAQVELTAAERELRRAERSWEYKVISRQDYEKAIDDVDKARIGLAHAKESVKLDSESLDFELETLRLEQNRQQLVVDDLERRRTALSLRAPVSGIVGDLAAEQRSYVAANASVASVIDLTALEVELSVADTYADDIALGTPVEIRYSGAIHRAAVTSVSPEVVNSTVKVRVRFDANQPNGLRQNQRLSARLILEARESVLAVERGPFFDTGGGRIIYRVNDNVAERTSIQTGATSIGQVEIIDGLEAGDLVVISDITKFRDADTVLLSQ